ncbi:hypothetical protein [Solimicrobium silvestre]|nr:hypothetical protein [Solimicrobium silvestre]
MKKFQLLTLFAEALFFCYFVWGALTTTHDKVLFLFNMGFLLIFLSGLYGDIFYYKDRFVRLKMSIPEIYKDAKTGKRSMTMVEHALLFLGFSFLAMSAYFKFFM